jgi:hypothetical protein
MSSLMLSQLTVKIPDKCHLFPELCYKPLCSPRAFISSSVMGVSRKSLLHPSGKVLCPAFYIRVTHAPSILIGSYILCRDSTNVCRMPLVVFCVTLTLSIMPLIRDSRRFHICKRWNRDGFSPRKRVASCVSVVMDWTRLLCSRTVLALRWLNVGVFSLGRLRSF